ncbi:MAG: hypothetical protein GF331_27350 [Chitinivibrionales bacterium]|nr:hypothetical protein [Chitinivibrionales bacterium]
MVLQIGLAVFGQGRDQAVGEQRNERWVYLESDNPRMVGKRQDRPVAEVLIQGDEYSRFSARTL